jgi:signal transduction histidine kinase
VELRVLDRGPGIAESLRPRLFEKFATTSALGRRSGFGLGLYLVRLVAQLHGGTAEALDRDGGGTVFRLRFGEEAP